MFYITFHTLFIYVLNPTIRFLLDIVQSAPPLINDVIHFLDDVERHVALTHYTPLMIQTLSRDLVQMDIEVFHAEAVHMLRLVNRIVQEKNVSPVVRK